CLLRGGGSGSSSKCGESIFRVVEATKARISGMARSFEVWFHDHPPTLQTPGLLEACLPLKMRASLRLMCHWTRPHLEFIFGWCNMTPERSWLAFNFPLHPP